MGCDFRYFERQASRKKKKTEEEEDAASDASVSDDEFDQYLGKWIKNSEFCIEKKI